MGDSSISPEKAIAKLEWRLDEQRVTNRWLWFLVVLALVLGPVGGWLAASQATGPQGPAGQQGEEGPPGAPGLSADQIQTLVDDAVRQTKVECNYARVVTDVNFFFQTTSDELVCFPNS